MKLTESYKKVIELEIERLRLNREKSKLVLEKSIMLYFIMLIVGVIGLIYDYIDPTTLNMMIGAGFFILIIGAIPYMRVVAREENKIKEFIYELKK